MNILEALAILEAATLEGKKRDIDTPEVREALDLLEPYVRPVVSCAMVKLDVDVHRC